MSTTPKTNAVTPISELQAACAPKLVELPGFEPDTRVTFRLGQANLRAMAKAGKIPNPLLPAAQRLYEGQSGPKASFQDIAKVMDIVVASAMVEPTMDELNAAGIELTEEQFGVIWGYSQRGAAALAAFRKQPGGIRADPNSQGVEGAAK